MSIDQINLSNQAILVELSIRAPSFRKLDKKISREVTSSKGADDDAGRFNKHLLAGTSQLDKLTKWVAATRVEFYARTLPWGGSLYLVDIRKYLELKDWLVTKQQEFTLMATDFLNIYPHLVSAQAFKMGAMFDRSEYPTPDVVARKFGFDFGFTPLPSSGDFRVDVGHEMAAELEAEYQKMYEARVKSVADETWSRLYEAVKRMSDRLSDKEEVDEDGNVVTGKKVLRDTVLTNLLDIVDFMRDMNVTNDENMEWARKQLADALCGVSMDDIRKSDGYRKSVKAKVDDIAEKLGW